MYIYHYGRKYTDFLYINMKSNRSLHLRPFFRLFLFPRVGRSVAHIATFFVLVLTFPLVPYPRVSIFSFHTPMMVSSFYSLPCFVLTVRPIACRHVFSGSFPFCRYPAAFYFDRFRPCCFTPRFIPIRPFCSQYYPAAFLSNPSYHFRPGVFSLVLFRSDISVQSLLSRGVPFRSVSPPSFPFCRFFLASLPSPPPPPPSYPAAQVLDTTAILSSLLIVDLRLSHSNYCFSFNRQDLEVVNNSGNVKRVRPQEVRGKRNTQSRRAFVVDAQQNQLEASKTFRLGRGRQDLTCLEGGGGEGAYGSVGDLFAL